MRFNLSQQFLIRFWFLITPFLFRSFVQRKEITLHVMTKHFYKNRLILLHVMVELSFQQWVFRCARDPLEPT